MSFRSLSLPKFKIVIVFHVPQKGMVEDRGICLDILATYLRKILLLCVEKLLRCQVGTLQLVSIARDTCLPGVFGDSQGLLVISDLPLGPCVCVMLPRS